MFSRRCPISLIYVSPSTTSRILLLDHTKTVGRSLYVCLVFNTFCIFHTYFMPPFLIRSSSSSSVRHSLYVLYQPCPRRNYIENVCARNRAFRTESMHGRPRVNRLCTPGLHANDDTWQNKYIHKCLYVHRYIYSVSIHIIYIYICV
jgi:hypothetical protein